MEDITDCINEENRKPVDIKNCPRTEPIELWRAYAAGGLIAGTIAGTYAFLQLFPKEEGRALYEYITSVFIK